MKMTNLLLGAAAIAITLGTANFAYATNWGNGDTNNYNDNSTTNNPVANGGAGGNGYGGNSNQNQGQYQGQTANGGTGIGVGIGQGGDANSSANAGAVSGSSSNSKSNASSGSVSGAYSGGNEQAATQNTNVNVEGDEAPDIPVSSASVAGLTASNGTCMGSSGGGVQGMTFGIAVNTTWMDEECDRRYDAAELRSLGMPEAAAALMCQKPAVRESMKRSMDPAKFAQLCEAPKQEAAQTETAEAAPVAGKNWFKSTTGNICYAERKPSCVRP